MEKYSNANDGVAYLLILIDLYSRFLTVYPLKKKSDVYECLLNFFCEESIYNYSRLFTDSGSEFVNKKCGKLYERLGITWYTTHSKEIKSSIAERVIRDIKFKIGKYITARNDERYINILEDVVYTFNLTNHSGILNEKTIGHSSIR